MIPKIIHYSWISNDDYPEDIKHNIDTWNKYLKDYEFKKWDDNTFDFNICTYVKNARNSKSWAHCSDYIRIWALYNYGGFWLDSDVEVFKSFNDLLMFPYVVTKETKYLSNNFTDMGLIGFEPYNPILKKMLDFYEVKEFNNSWNDGEIIPLFFKNIINDMGVIEVTSTTYENFEHLKELMISNSNYLYHLNNFVYFHKDSSNSFAQHYLKGSWINKTDNLCIYIAAHKNIANKLPEDKTHFIIAQHNDIKDDRLTRLICDDEFTKNHSISYGENCQIHYLWTHSDVIKDKEYIGINHYHRFFKMLNKHNNFEDIKSIKDNIDNGYIYVSEPWVYDYDKKIHTNKDSLLIHHNINIDILLQILEKLFPQYIEEYNKMLQRNYFYNRSMFIMSKDKFMQYCDFLFPILNEFDKIIGVNNDDDMKLYIEKNIDNYNIKNVGWQCRLDGFIAERLFDIWVRYNYKDKINILHTIEY